MENQEKHYYLKLEDFEILPMFGECAIDVTNSKVKIELDKNKNGDEKNEYTNREIVKSNKLLLVFCSLSLEGTKEGEVIQLDYQHVYVWDLEKLFVLHVLLFCIFSGGPIGVIFANIICEIFALLKPLWL